MPSKRPSKRYHVDLSDSEGLKREEIVKKRKSRSEIVKRSNMLLSADRNGLRKWKDAEISSQYEVSTRTIERLRKRYVEDGLAVALKGKPRLNLDK